MDPLLAADRIPRLAGRAMRQALVRALSRGRRTPRAVVDEALVAFERSVQREAAAGVRPALLFAERDRIVSELGRFLTSRLAARLFAVHRRDVVAVESACAPFAGVVRGHGGRLYGVAIRRLPALGRRLEWLRRCQASGRSLKAYRLDGIVVYDLTTGRTRYLDCRAAKPALAA